MSGGTNYLGEIDGLDAERVQAASVRYNSSALTSAPELYPASVEALLPARTGRQILGAPSVGVTSVADAPSLIPFYALQLIPVCAHCIERGRYTVEDATQVLEPMIDAGLAIPVLYGSLGSFPRPLADILSRSPRIPRGARSALPQAYLLSLRTPQDPILCTMCSESAACTTLEPLRAAHDRIAGLAWSENDLSVLAGIEYRARMLGPECAKAIGGMLLAAPTDQVDPLVRTVDSTLDNLDELLFAASVGGRAALSETMLCQLQANDWLPIDNLAGLQNDVRLRLDVAEHLGIAFAPSADVAKYVSVVAPFAGSLTAAFGGDWVVDADSGAEAIDAAAEIASEVNDSVARIARGERLLHRVGSAIANPFLRTAAWAVVGAKVSPLLGAAGLTTDVGHQLVRSALDEQGQISPHLAMPSGLREAVESVLGLAPASLAVHGIRKRVQRSISA